MRHGLAFPRPTASPVKRRLLAVVALCLLAGGAAWGHPGAGIVVSPQGEIYFVDGYPSRIMKVDAAGRMSVFVADAEKLSHPHHLALDRDGNLYSAGDQGGKVWQISPSGKLASVYPPPGATEVRQIGAGGDPFTRDAAGNLYAVEGRQFQQSRILKITPQGGITILAGGAWGHADGRGEQAKFGDLHGAGFVCAPDGTLYLTDGGTSVRKVLPDGTVTTIAGGPEPGFADGKGPAARFNGAMGLALDARGNLYVADTGNHRIRKVAPDGTVTTLAGSGQEGSADGPALAATFVMASGVAVGPKGEVYVLEHGYRDDPRVRRITAAGQVTTVAAGRPLGPPEAGALKAVRLSRK
jgi:sugar lactone lactonase YvrE